MKPQDEALSQIRTIRHTISEEHEHDPRKLVAYYIALQKQYPHLAQISTGQEDYDPKG